jgi:hypothetical protein
MANGQAAVVVAAGEAPATGRHTIGRAAVINPATAAALTNGTQGASANNAPATAAASAIEPVWTALNSP